MDAIEIIILSLLFILPAYVANSSAALFGGGLAIDFGKTLGGKRILGDGKTWRGLLLGVFFGTAAGNIEGYFLMGTQYAFGNLGFCTLLGLLLSFGALAGDLVKSFIKRRMGIERGKSWPIVDQLDFVAGAIVFGSILYLPPLEMLAFLIFLTPIMHLFLNYLGYKLKCKKVPW